MSGGFFKKLSPEVKRTQQHLRVDNPFIYKGRNPEIYFITDSFDRKQIGLLEKAVQKVFGFPTPDFSLLYAYKIRATSKEVSKNVSGYVLENTIDYGSYIPPGSKIVSIGRTIYSLTKETTFNALAFYPFNYFDSYFYHPPTKSYVFPVDDYYLFTSDSKNAFYDNFNSFFFFKQLELLKNFKPKPVRLPQLICETVDNPNELLVKYTGQNVKVAMDLETTGLSFYKNDIICLTLSFDGRTGYFLDFKDIDLDILSEFFKGKYLIGANLKFDIKFLRFKGVKNLKIDFDTLNAGQVLNEMTSNALSAHGWRYTYYGGHEIELKSYLHKNPRISGYANIPRSILSKYAAMDAIITYQVYERQLELLKDDPLLYKYYFEEVVPNLNMFIDIELKGVFVDWGYIKDLKEELEKEKTKIEKEIFEIVGRPFNIGSQEELAEVLEKDLRLPDLGTRSKKGLYLTNEISMNIWEASGFEIAKKIMAYRSINTQINTFVGSETEDKAYWKYRLGDKVFPDYKVMLAQSHRNKCSSPNFQQIPKRIANAKMIRKMFRTPSDKFVFSEGDYAGFQMRIAAIISRDKNLIEAFTKYGGDVHSMTAVAIFHRDWELEDFLKVKHESPYKEQRNIAKGTNFAFLFGGSARAFADDILRVEWTGDYCKKFIEDLKINMDVGADIFYTAGEYIRDSFFKKYPGLSDWHTLSHQTARQKGAIRSVHGARRLIPQLLYIGQDSDRREVANFQNISKNSPVQNFEVVAMLRAMRLIHGYFENNDLESSLFGMIHDATEFYLHRDELDIVIPKIFEFFEKDYEEYLGVPMEFDLDIADPEEGEIWGFGKEIKNVYKN